MDQSSFEHLAYRVGKLEEEALPRRMQAAELIIGQLQGEIVAIKEIARSIGVKLDSGIEKLTTESNLRHQTLSLEQKESYAFVKGIMWASGAVIAVVVFFAPLLGEAIKKVLGV